MTIHKCGTIATTKVGNITCMITACCIRFDDAQYEIEYFIDGQIKKDWVNIQQLNITKLQKLTKIGFIK